MKDESGKQMLEGSDYWKKLEGMAEAIDGIESWFIYRACLSLSLRDKQLTRRAVVERAKQFKADYERSEDDNQA